MERWADQVAIVTGASAGIGAGIVEGLLNHNLKVVGLARRQEKLDELSDKYKGKKFYGIKTDISKEEDIVNAFKWIKENVGPVSILINNAGIAKSVTLMDGSASDFKETLDTNIFGLTLATREALQDMRDNNVAGHILHINSVAGHYVPHFPNLNVYAASKYAVTALTETLRQELNTIGSKIKVTSVSPGVVKTSIHSTNDFSEEVLKIVEAMPKLNVKDVVESIIHVLGTPPHVQITELTIRPVGEIP